jgi:lysophospholipase L1-like esterase
MRQKQLAPALLAGALVACASQEVNLLPSPTPLATPTPVGTTYAVDALVYYDESNDGRLGAEEIARVPNVDVRLGSQVARSAKATGAVRITGVPAGNYTPSLEHLPPYFQAGSLTPISVPTSGGLYLPAKLDVGSNRPNVYLAFGDSITIGDGSTDGSGYRGLLATGLRLHFGKSKIIEDGVTGTRSAKGKDRIGASLAEVRPAYTLIMYGTNDWNDAICKNGTGCPTVANLESIVQQTFSSDSLPVLATILPSNPSQNPAERNTWVATTNDALRARAYTQGFLLADVHKAFMAAPNLSALFYDHVHPNDAGYAIIAREFLRAISGDPTATVGTADVVAGLPGPPTLLPIEGATPALDDSLRGAGVPEQ